MKTNFGVGFRGEAPRFERDKIPPGFAARAVNCRFLSGSLEAWKAPADAPFQTTKAGTVRSLHLMDPDGNNGGPFALHWTELVQAVRGTNAGDTEERTYFTGTADGPRVTTKTLATAEPPPGGVNAGEYPYRSLPLGVRKPAAAPTVSLQAGDEPGEITLTNPGAENGTTNWTSTTGTLGYKDDSTDPVSGLPAFSGNRFFYGGTTDCVAYSRSPSPYLLEDLDLVPGQLVTLRWQQARGANSSKACVGVEFYDGAATKIGEQFAAMETVAALLTWTERTMSGTTIPDNTVSLRIVQKYEKVGGGETDAYIDDISMFSQAYDQTFEGSSLSGWVVQGFFIDAVEGRPAPCFNSGNPDDSTTFMYRNLASEKSPRVAFQCDLYKTEQEFKCEAGILLHATEGGQGAGVTLDREGGLIAVKNFTAWTNTGSALITKLYEGGKEALKNKWLRITISAERKSAVTSSWTISVVGIDNGVTYVDAQTVEVPIDGDYGGLRHYGGDDANRNRFDNVSFSVLPADVAEDGGQIFTDYVYTFVDSLGRESAPSPDSADVALTANGVRLVTTSTTNPTGYDITHKRIYRLVTGTTSSQYQLVDEIPLAQAEYEDTKVDSQLGAVLQTDGWEEPPEDMHSIIAAPRFMAGISKNQVCFSVIDQPHAWPPLWRQNMDEDGVGLAVIDNDIFAWSKGRPYIAQGTDPSAMDLQKLSKPIGCLSRESIAIVGKLGVIACSSDGLSAANRADTDLWTRALFTEAEFAVLNPPSIRGVCHDGRYFGFYDAEGLEFEVHGVEVEGVKGGFIIDTEENGFGVTWLDFHATAAYASPFDDRLYLEVDGTLKVWNAGPGKLDYVLESREELIKYPTSFGAAYVDALTTGDTDFTLIYDRTDVHTRAVQKGEFVLPDVLCERAVAYRLEGTDRIRRQASIADTMEELD